MPPRADTGVDWPGILAEIAAVAGHLAAYRVAEAKGGRQAYFPTPSRLRDDHWLVIVCGWEAARAIAKRCGGLHTEVPLGPFAGNRAAIRRAIRDLLAQQVSGQEIASRVGVTDRTVRNVKRDVTKAVQDDQFRLL